ncbi:hypothetical protein CBR_g11922 [Chara braunii]|uniref:Uncharacterized protein n=1 Tax=Chara braunii TaxID=69332 RepID=A0A388KQK9_CHABU|nr:hypothetical protein CBR_g11922 [Chara braunii]|eukprot:GBG72344.1 hypothetical protein CBR_g11922 [Chara braunii]
MGVSKFQDYTPSERFYCPFDDGEDDNENTAPVGSYGGPAALYSASNEQRDVNNVQLRVRGGEEQTTSSNRRLSCISREQLSAAAAERRRESLKAQAMQRLVDKRMRHEQIVRHMREEKIREDRCRRQKLLERRHMRISHVVLKEL